MFEPEDFKLSLESSLRLRVITDEIEECSDRDALKANLKDCVRMTMQYQQLLQKVLDCLAHHKPTHDHPNGNKPV